VREDISSIYEESRMYRKAGDTESREAEKQKPFHDMIDDLFSGNPIDKSKYARTYFHVAEAPDFMKKVGLIGAEFTIPFKAISIHLGKDTEHKMTSTEWHGLSEAIKSPFLITSYGKKKDRFRLYTKLLFNGNPIVVGVDVKRINQGASKPQLEINSIKTVFAKSNKISPEEQVVCYDKRLTPEQVALLGGHNFRQYPTIQELSFDKDNNAKDGIQENSVKNDTVYRSGEFSPASDSEIGEAVRIGKSLGMEVEVVNEPGSENAGYYDTKTGQVVVNSAKGGEGEAVKTVLHEVVGHKGLVAVLGEKADTFFGDVYDIIGATEQRKIYKLYKDSYGLNSDFENISAQDKRLIAQEYCATVSEGDIYNPTTLNKIRDFMVKAFRAVGINVKLSNRDVQMMLRKSRKYQERQAIVSEEVNKLPKIEISSMKGVSATEAVKVMEAYSDAQKYIDENGIKSALTIGRLFEIQKSEPGILGKAIGEQEAIHQDVLNEINGTFNEKLVNQINGAVDATPY
ncbi:MAG: hypothetical protein RR383_10165, partial [Muribaculaceae bacterium]